MGIVVKHGGSALIALGREAGVAQGEAEAARIKAEQDRQLAQTVLRMGNDLAQGISLRFQRLHDSEEREKQRQFQARENELNRGTRLDVADLNESGRNYRAGLAEEGKNLRFDAGEEGKANRLERNIASKEGMAAASLDERRDYHDRSLDLGEKKLEASSKLSFQQQENRGRALDLQARGLDVREAGMSLQADKVAQQREKTALAKDLQEQKVKAEKTLHDALDTENMKRNGGVLVPDLEWAQGHAAVKKMGYLPPALYANLHASLGGARPTATPLKDDQYAAIAAFDPERAKQVAGAMDTLSKQPTPSAMKMQQALLQLTNAPQFNPKDNPQYFQNMERAVQEWSQAGPPDPMVAPLFEKYEQERQRRQVALLPEVVKNLKAIRLSGGNVGVYLNQAGVSEDELLRFAEDYAARGGQNGP